MRRYQKGISMVGVLTLIGVMAIFIKIGATVGPTYYEFYTVDKIIASLYRDGRASSVNDFKRALSNSFQINNIRDKDPDDFEYQFEAKRLTVIVDYEVRRPFIGNMDVVVHFNKTYGSEIKPDF